VLFYIKIARFGAARVPRSPCRIAEVLSSTWKFPDDIKTLNTRSFTGEWILYLETFQTRETGCQILFVAHFFIFHLECNCSQGGPSTVSSVSRSMATTNPAMIHFTTMGAALSWSRPAWEVGRAGMASSQRPLVSRLPAYTVNQVTGTQCTIFIHSFLIFSYLICQNRTVRIPRWQVH